jgi:hypothetical protein
MTHFADAALISVPTSKPLEAVDSNRRSLVVVGCPQRITIITGVVRQFLALVLKNCWLPCSEQPPSKELLGFAGKELLPAAVWCSVAGC